MILLPPADLDQDEAIFRILAHLRTFQQTADSLFDRISSRTEELNATYRSLDTRLKRVQRKVSHLRQMNTSGVLTCLSQFPTCEYSPARDLTADTDKPANVVFKPKHQPQRVVDMRRELDERKRFYLPSHLMNKNPQEPRKERQLPSKIMSFADMFYCDTDELAYGKRSSKRIGFVSHGKSDTTSSVDVNVVEASAIGGGRTQERDPLDYVPELGPIEDLDLPDILPDLPGIAEDLTLLDYGIVPPMFSDIPVLNEEVQAAPESERDTESSGESVEKSKCFKHFYLMKILVFHFLVVIAANTEMRHSSNDSPQLTLSAAEKEAVIDGLPAIGEVKAATIPSPPPAVPPPPPPPPPANLVVNTASPSPPGLPSAPLSNDRSDLMAAIRAAGGAGKAKLKKVNSSRRAAKESESLSSSALGENKSSAGGDLMASLAKALEARRKAIAGMGTSRGRGDPLDKERGTGQAQRSDGNNSGDDEWK